MNFTGLKHLRLPETTQREIPIISNDCYHYQVINPYQTQNHAITSVINGKSNK